jgi:hypothetical protein
MVGIGDEDMFATLLLLLLLLLLILLLQLPPQITGVWICGCWCNCIGRYVEGTTGVSETFENTCIDSGLWAYRIQ